MYAVAVDLIVVDVSMVIGVIAYMGLDVVIEAVGSDAYMASNGTIGVAGS